MENKLKTSSNGVSMIKSFESFRPRPYNDANGNATIGYGHLLHMGSVTNIDWLKYGNGISEESGTAMLKLDLSTAEDAVNQLVLVNLNQNQFDAAVDFVYNLGREAFLNSSVLKYINAEDYDQACQYILMYDKSGGKVLEGLTRRREKEVELFNTPVSAQ